MFMNAAEHLLVFLPLMVVVERVGGSEASESKSNRLDAPYLKFKEQQNASSACKVQHTERVHVGTNL